MSFGNGRSVLILVVVVVGAILTVFGQDSNRTPPPAQEIDLNGEPARVPGHPEIMDTTPTSQPSPLKRPTAAPTPSPTPELGCTTCMQVPVFNLENERLPAKFRLWKGITTEGSSITVSAVSMFKDTVKINVSFADLIAAPSGTKYIVWARLPEDKFIPLGELRYSEKGVETSFTQELKAKQFGLFVTLESEKKLFNFAGETFVPTNVLVATVSR